MSHTEDWIRLTSTPGLGAVAARKLLTVFGLPGQIFSASLADLKQVVSPRQAAALLRAPDAITRSLIDQVNIWCQQARHHLVTLADTSYPHALLHIPDPPLLLYAHGDLTLLNQLMLAVVGSRNATAQGIRTASEFARHLARCGITIVSGLAQGIDTAAHSGALESGGSTVAVIGTGIDLVYPRANQALSEQIAERGCVISEYPLGTAALAANFPRRNRIISGLARGVLVVEAAAQSGSLITARQAAEQGRDVFAIPGSIHAPLAKGCHQLIKQGAKLVECASDILEELGDTAAPNRPTLPDPSKQTLTAQQSCLLHQMGFDPVHPDTLLLHSNLDHSALASVLLALEMAGQVEVMEGGWVRRRN